MDAACRLGADALILADPGVLAYAMAMKGTPIYEQVSNAYQVTLVGAFIPLVFGLYWKRATRQGAIAHWLYIMVSGEAEAWWQPPEGPRRLLEKRGPGSVFGEIGLMTGAPRRDRKSVV